jgi:hypothetical protein
VSGWALRIDGLPYLLTTQGVSSISSWDGDDPGQTIAQDTLEPPEGELSARLRPLEGLCEVSNLSFVVHDLPRGSAQYGLTDLFTRRLNGITKTYLTASATSSDTSFTPADLAIFTSLPRDAWINGECVRVTSTGVSTIDVTRGRYGSKASAITVDDAAAILPEIYLSFPWVTRRRCVLYRVRNGAATVRWIGYADHAPRLNADGASWTISATWAGVRELGSSIGSEVGGARTIGYDGRAIAILFQFSNDSTTYGSSGYLNPKAAIYQSLGEALADACARAQQALAGIAGITSASVGYSSVGSSYAITATTNGSGAFKMRVVCGDLDVEASSPDAGTYKRATVTLENADLGGLARFGFTSASASGGVDKFTVLAFSPETPTDDASWTPTTAGYAVEVRATPMLSAEWNDDARLILDHRGSSSGVVNTADTTSVTPQHTTFKGAAYLRPNDAGARFRPPADAGALRSRGVTLFRREYLVESDHWLYALRWVLSDPTLTKTLDSRNWDWSEVDRVAGLTASGSAAAVEWRIDASRDTGEFVADEALLRGACLSVRAGRLCIEAIRQPTAAETPVATITAADLEAGQLPQWEDWEDGLRTSVRVTSPLREVTVQDAVSVARHGSTEPLALRAEGLRNSESAITDPLAWARDVAMRPLRLWSDPVYLVRLPLTVQLVDTIELGDVIAITHALLPDGLGARGMSAVRAQVVGISEGLQSGSLLVEAVVFPVAYGYAPCARVASIAGAVLTLDTTYAGSAGDYAGSGLAWYQGTASDAGASMFAAGDVVELVQRDTTSSVVEQRTVLSVNPAAKTITLTVAPSAPWAGYSMVDVRFIDYGAAVTAQKTAYAYACSSTAPQVIGGTADEGRHWAT